MITIIHGDDIERSRDAYVRLRSSCAEDLIEFQGSSLDEATLTHALESKSMFMEERTVFIERLFGKGKVSQKIQSLAGILERNANTSHVVIWEQHEVAKGSLSLLPSAKVLVHMLPKTLFQFIDRFRTDNPADLIRRFDLLMEEAAPELVLSLLLTRIRHLIMIKDGITPTTVKDWQVGRLTSQSAFFTMKQLVELQRNLVDIEYSIKSGTSGTDLKNRLRFHFLSL